MLFSSRALTCSIQLCNFVIKIYASEQQLKIEFDQRFHICFWNVYMQTPNIDWKSIACIRSQVCMSGFFFSFSPHIHSPYRSLQPKYCVLSTSVWLKFYYYYFCFIGVATKPNVHIGNIVKYSMCIWNDVIRWMWCVLFSLMLLNWQIFWDKFHFFHFMINCEMENFPQWNTPDVERNNGCLLSMWNSPQSIWYDLEWKRLKFTLWLMNLN